MEDTCKLIPAIGIPYRLYLAVQIVNAVGEEVEKCPHFLI